MKGKGMATTAILDRFLGVSRISLLSFCNHGMTERATQFYTSLSDKNMRKLLFILLLSVVLTADVDCNPMYCPSD